MTVSLDNLRRRILAGESYTREELMEAIQQLRSERTAVAEKATAKRQATKGMSDEELDEDFSSLIAQVKAEKEQK